MIFRGSFSALACLLAGLTLADDPPRHAANTNPPGGDAVIRRAAGRSEIVVTTTDRLAGAIHSLTWDGLDDGPGEQAWPLVFATASGSHAMGIVSPDQPSAGYENVGYGRFRFVDEKVVKWNCVFRYRDETGIAAGDYRFRIFVAVGTLDDVRRSIAVLVEDFSR